MSEQFISEAIVPAAGSFDTAAMARGEAGLPSRFGWRGKEYAVAQVLENWVSSSPEGGSGEMYLRRHWWKVRTSDGAVMTIYCERSPKPARAAKARWFLYTVEGAE